MKRTILCSVLFALASTCLAGAAHAAGSHRVDAGFRNVQLGVMDLTPDDGIAASYTIASSRVFHQPRFYSYLPYYSGGSISQWAEGFTPSAYDLGENGGIARTESSGTLGGISAAAGVRSEHGTLSEAEAQIYQGVALSLAPNSVLTFSGQFYLSSAFGDPADTGFRSEYDEFVSLSSAGTTWSRETTWGTVTAGETVSPFWFAIANTSNTEQEVFLGLSTRARTQVYPYDDSVSAPVPEPTTWTMLIAGLGMTGFMARRRARALRA